MPHLFWVAVSIASLPLLYYGLPCLHKKVSRALLYRRAVRSNAIVLTFDDGPGDRLTPAILKILRENNATATFFLLGRSIAGKEHIVRQIAAEGHEIGSHGYNHLNSWRAWPFLALSNIIRGWRAIDAALGVDGGTYPFRPPYGKLDLLSLLYLRIRKTPIVYWTVDCGDTWPITQRDVQWASLLVKKLRGGVVLAHDNDRQRSATELLVQESLKLVLAVARENNIQIWSASRLLGLNKEPNSEGKSNSECRHVFCPGRPRL